jgi:hypothetical protein
MPITSKCNNRGNQQHPKVAITQINAFHLFNSFRQDGTPLSGRRFEHAFLKRIRAYEKALLLSTTESVEGARIGPAARHKPLFFF